MGPRFTSSRMQDAPFSRLFRLTKGYRGTTHGLFIENILIFSFQIHNEEQLSNWCLHFISSNYIAFEKRREFPLLTGSNKTHVEEHRWPPLSYLKEVEVYEQEMEKAGEKCSIM